MSDIESVDPVVAAKEVARLPMLQMLKEVSIERAGVHTSLQVVNRLFDVFRMKKSADQANVEGLLVRLGAAKTRSGKDSLSQEVVVARTSATFWEQVEREVQRMKKGLDRERDEQEARWFEIVGQWADTDGDCSVVSTEAAWSGDP